MTWNAHIEQVAAKGNKKLGFLKRNLKVNNPEIKSRAYKTLVRPSLEYCGTVWDPHTAAAAQKVEMVQRRAARWVKNDYVQTSSVTNMLAELKWRELSQRRADARLCLLYKIKKSLVLINAIKYFRLQRDKIHIQNIESDRVYYKMSFFPRTIQDWNPLPNNILTTDTARSFRDGVARHEHYMPY